MADSEKQEVRFLQRHPYAVRHLGERTTITVFDHDRAQKIADELAYTAAPHKMEMSDDYIDLMNKLLGIIYYHGIEIDPIDKRPIGNVPEDMLDHPIEDMDLDTRPYNALRSVGIETAGALGEKCTAELRIIQGLGAKSMDNIFYALDREGWLNPTLPKPEPPDQVR